MEVFPKLITVKKITNMQYPPPAFAPPVQDTGSDDHIPAHKDFREKYFHGFKKPEDCESHA